MEASVIFALLIFLALGLIVVLQGMMWRTILAVFVSLGVLVITMGIASIISEGSPPSDYQVGALLLAVVTLGLLLGLVWATNHRRMMWTIIYAVPVSLVVGFAPMGLPSYVDPLLTLPTGTFILVAAVGFLLWAINRRHMPWTMISAVLVAVIGFVMLPYGIRGLYKLTGIFLGSALPTALFFFIATLSLLLGLAHYRRTMPQPSPATPTAPRD